MRTGKWWTLMRLLLLLLVGAAIWCWVQVRAHSATYWKQTVWSCCGSNICLQQRMHTRWQTQAHTQANLVPVELPPALRNWVPRCDGIHRVTAVDGRLPSFREIEKAPIVAVGCELNKGEYWFDARTGLRIP